MRNFCLFDWFLLQINVQLHWKQSHLSSFRLNLTTLIEFVRNNLIIFLNSILRFYWLFNFLTNLQITMRLMVLVK